MSHLPDVTNARRSGARVEVRERTPINGRNRPVYPPSTVPNQATRNASSSDFSARRIGAIRARPGVGREERHGTETAATIQRVHRFLGTTACSRRGELCGARGGAAHSRQSARSPRHGRRRRRDRRRESRSVRGLQRRGGDRDRDAELERVREASEARRRPCARRLPKRDRAAARRACDAEAVRVPCQGHRRSQCERDDFRRRTPVRQRRTADANGERSAARDGARARDCARGPISRDQRHEDQRKHQNGRANGGPGPRHPPAGSTTTCCSTRTTTA